MRWPPRVRSGEWLLRDHFTVTAILTASLLVFLGVVQSLQVVAS